MSNHAKNTSNSVQEFFLKVKYVEVPVSIANSRMCCIAIVLQKLPSRKHILCNT